MEESSKQRSSPHTQPGKAPSDGLLVKAMNDDPTQPSYTLLKPDRVPFQDRMTMPKSFSKVFRRNRTQHRNPHDSLTVQLKTPAQEFMNNHIHLNNRKTVENKTQRNSKHGNFNRPASKPTEHTEERFSPPPSRKVDQHCKHFQNALQSFEEQLPPKSKHPSISRKSTAGMKLLKRLRFRN